MQLAFRLGFCKAALCRDRQYCPMSIRGVQTHTQTVNTHQFCSHPLFGPHSLFCLIISGDLNNCKFNLDCYEAKVQKDLGVILVGLVDKFKRTVQFPGVLL